MKTTLCGLMLLLAIAPGWACVNKSGTKYGGGSGSYYGDARSLDHSLKRNLHAEGEKMEADLRDSTEFKDRSDYAVALMYLGRAPEAVELLRKLEAEKPGEYFVAANLGTALELSGQNEEALRWIKEGMARNPDSHHGTEWVHVKILEAKIAHETNPNYFEQHTVLGLQPQEVENGVTINGKTMSPDTVAKAINYQLTERVPFVKAPDPAVASLLFDYAALEAVRHSMESARAMLKLAAEYGYPSPKIVALNAEFDRRIVHATLQFYFLVGLALVAITWWTLRRYQRSR